MDSETARVISLMEKSEYFRDLKNKEELIKKLYWVYHIDIGNEIKKMDLWLWANPNKRYKNYTRFIVGWIARVDNPYVERS